MSKSQLNFSLCLDYYAIKTKNYTVLDLGILENVQSLETEKKENKCSA